VSLLLLALAHAGQWAPTDWPPPAGVSAATPEAPPPTGLLESLYRRYRRYSALDGPRCPFYPTCSAYAVGAVRQRGAVLGVLLTVDRLLREHPGMMRHDHYPVVTPHETPRLHDPVPAGRRAR
jgi:putative component of membrane protein insertase Oxa1/YidC/SpoIIIJ protein YidD